MDDIIADNLYIENQGLSTQENVACVKARLQEEGREARNLIAYSLPLQTRKNPSTASLYTDKNTKAPQAKENKKLSADVCRLKQDKRHRSASAGRDPQAGLRARHWGFLFRNLQQAVDEIYQTAEDDESIIECKEAILMLERYASDFYKLIEWLKLKWEYENTLPPQRPNSLAWAIRTSSPAKLFRSERKSLTLFETKKTLSFERAALCKDTRLEGPPKGRVPHPPPTIVIERTKDGISQSGSPGEGGMGEPTVSDGAHISLPEGVSAREWGGLQDPLVEEPPSVIADHFPQMGDGGSLPLLGHSPNPIPTLVPAAQADPSLCSDKVQSVSTDSPHKATPTNQSIDTKVEVKCDGLKKSGLPSREEVRPESEGKGPPTHMHPTKSPHQKQGPLVNMNKASQVRKAFNQNRTPLKTPPGGTSLWKSSATPSIEKSSCTKQQSAGWRLSMRRLAEEKTHQSPPLRRKMTEHKSLPQRPIGSGVTGPMRNLSDRSSTTNPAGRVLVRSCTTLEGSTSAGGRSYDNSQSMLTSEGRCPSTASLASSSNTSSSGLSWADKVKGGASTHEQDSVSKISLQDEDEEGWEVVRRNRRSHGGSAASLNSQGLPSNKPSHRIVQKRAEGTSFRMQRRFEVPSSAVSMPSLSAAGSDLTDRCPREITAPHPAKSDTGLKTTSRSKPRLASIGSAEEAKKKVIVNRAGVSCTVSGTGKESNISKPSNEDQSRQVVLGFSQARVFAPTCEKTRKNVANTRTQKAGKLGSSHTSQGATADPNEGISNPLPKDVNGALERLCIEAHSEDMASNGGGSCEDPGTSSPKPQAKVPSVPHAFAYIPAGFSIRDRDSDDESEREREEEIRSNAEAFESVLKEEQKLKQEIEETERASFEECERIEEDTEPDANLDDEGTPLGGIDGNSEPSNSVSSDVDVSESFYQYDPAFSKMASLSWAEEMDALDNIDDVRPPGRVLHIHEKLSSPSRKLPISEKFRRHKEKLAKAQELRGKLILAKTEKLKDLFRKIDVVNIEKERLLIDKRELFERKMERAEEKRRSHLREIVNKAHDEENKAKEIAFINGLEAQNKLHDIMQQHQSHESRLADMAEERSRRQEEKAAKEAAAQERRRALEAERHARMVELCEKRRRRCEKIDRQQAERREELLEQAREKARDREERLSALQQAQQAKESELVKKIQQKQEETARRHEENIEQIRQKALESSILKYSRGSDEAPKLRRYETNRMCTLCTSVITSEVYLLSHLCSRRHIEALKELHKRDISQEESETYNLKFIINAPANIADPQVSRDKERQKLLKKRCRKVRTRMASRGKEFLKKYSPPVLKDLPHKGRMLRSLTQVKKLLSNQGIGPWAAADIALLDKHLLEILRILEKDMREKQVFACLDGFQYLFPLLELIQNGESGSICVVPARSLAFCARVMVAACKQSSDNSHFLLHSNLAGRVVELLLRRLQDLATEAARGGSSNSLNSVANLPSDPASAALMELLAQVLQEVLIVDKVEKTDDNWSRIQDVVSYCVSLGVADKICWYFSQVQNPVENDPPSAEIILAAMNLLSVLTGKLSHRSQLDDDPTHLISTFHVLDACGVISLLYGLLLHQGGRSPSPPAASLLSPSTLAISAAATTFLHNLAQLDLAMFQAILGSEGISLEFRHIASFLLWYCSHWPSEEVLHNVIGLVGFFAANNRENQSIIQSGETPSVLQQLCSLPWPYFSEPRLTDVLFPSLLACCLGNDDNINILEQEMTFQVLEDYMEKNVFSKKSLLNILQTNRVSE